MDDTSTDLQKIRDEATAYAIDAAEAKREAERKGSMLEEARTQLVDVTAERDELRRELTQVQGAERAVRRLVIRARLDGRTHLALDEVMAELETRG